MKFHNFEANIQRKEKQYYGDNAINRPYKKKLQHFASIIKLQNVWVCEKNDKMWVYKKMCGAWKA